MSHFYNHSQRKIAGELNMALGNVKYYIDKFQKSNIIKRVGKVIGKLLLICKVKQRIFI